jgi:hypothetical protein
MKLESGPRISLKIQKLQNAATLALCTWDGWWRGCLGGGLERKMRAYLEKINFDLEEEKELGMQKGC